MRAMGLLATIGLMACGGGQEVIPEVRGPGIAPDRVIYHMEFQPAQVTIGDPGQFSRLRIEAPERPGPPLPLGIRLYYTNMDAGYGTIGAEWSWASGYWDLRWTPPADWMRQGDGRYWVLTTAQEIPRGGAIQIVR